MKSITILSFGFYAACRLGNAYELDPADIDLLIGHPIHETNDFKHSHEHRLKTDGDLNKYPNITLDYGIHRPTYDNPDAGYVLYKNIRYGQNPIGDLRFALPIAPAKVEISNDTELPVFDGSDGHSCYQANTRWANDKVVNSGRPYYNWEKAFRTETDGDDCLFLDVATPTEAVVGEKYPVLVWIYGGGYIYGAKDVDLYSPAGFYRRATANNKFVYVAINYRLGAFGFLAGPKFKAEGGRPNLGLYDQRLALKWVQDNIDKFFGDPMRVTVMGESAGAGSIVHQLVWNEGGDAPNNTFQKAIISSPAWVPIPGSQEGFEYQDATYVRFLEILGAKDLAEARNKSEDEIKEASKGLIWEAPYGTFVTGPVVDGDTIKDHPLTILLEGKQDKTVQIFTGTVGGEGLPFVPTKTLPSKWEEIRRWRDWSRDDILTYIFDALPLLNNQAGEEILHLYSPYDYEYVSTAEIISRSSPPICRGIRERVLITQC
ncbi:Alpha/Beta hydrolase protein [Bisporella sp. PMI_857]|nr:Alpha/Beta hydrolase protein [Bisporella sp. PMI_857]